MNETETVPCKEILFKWHWDGRVIQKNFLTWDRRCSRQTKLAVKSGIKWRQIIFGLGIWCLMPEFQQYFSYIVAIILFRISLIFVLFIYFSDVRMEDFFYEKLDKKKRDRISDHELLGVIMVDAGNVPVHFNEVPV
jgi:hypothetical protein